MSLAARADMKWRLAFAFGAGFLTAVILSFRVPSKPPCHTGDLTSGVALEKRKPMEELYGQWIRNVRECHVGDYLVDAPAREGSPEIMVSTQNHPFLVVSKKTITLIDHGSEHILYQW